MHHGFTLGHYIRQCIHMTKANQWIQSRSCQIIVTPAPIVSKSYKDCYQNIVNFPIIFLIHSKGQYFKYSFYPHLFSYSLESQYHFEPLKFLQGYQHRGMILLLATGHLGMAGSSCFQPDKLDPWCCPAAQPGPLTLAPRRWAPHPAMPFQVLWWPYQGPQIRQHSSF